MISDRYVSVDTVIEKFKRDWEGPITEDFDFHDGLEWIGEALDKIGAPKRLIEKVTDGNEELGHPCHVDIDDFRGILPNDVFKIQQVREANNWIPIRHTTDTFHQAYHCDENQQIQAISGYELDLTYQVNGSYLFTNFESGKIEISYLAVPTDKRGYPLIPDDDKFKEACAAYIATKIGRQMVIKGKMSPVIFRDAIESEWLWYVGAADTAARVPDYDEAQTWKNIIVRLIPNINEDRKFFRDLGRQERRYNRSTSGGYGYNGTK
jgi:hypothetical protein